MPYGFMGKILKVDLSTGKHDYIELKESVVRKYLGGSGPAALMLYTEFDHTLEPLHPDSPLIIMAGLFVGTMIPTACKTLFCAKSPQTGIWTESTVGGFFGQKLKAAGLDGVIITGKAEKPVYIWAKEDGIEIKPAAHLWGMETYLTESRLKSETDKGAQAAVIGPAGENLVKISSIMIGGHEGRAAGRTGLGSLMGSKNLKAVVVSGNKKPEVYNPEGLKESVKKMNKQLKEVAVGLTKFGTAGFVMTNEQSGDMPVRNFGSGRWEEGAKKTCGQVFLEKTFVRNYGCFACPILCGKVMKLPAGPHAGEEVHSPEYETAAGFGSVCFNEDGDTVVLANDLCNRLGIDTISASGVAAFALEAYEKGIIMDKDNGGEPLKWGDPQAILSLLEKIAYRKDIGDLLSEGVKGASEILGKNSAEFAVHVKGLEFAYHDPRAFSGMVANYSTANRGACHLEGITYFIEGGAVPAETIGYKGEKDRFSGEGKALLAVLMQNYMNVLNALGLCKFLVRGHVGINDVKEWLKIVCNWDVSFDEVHLIGERLHNLKRLYNVRLGISRKDDILPLRLLTLDRGGVCTGKLPNWGKIMSEYYIIRGWSEEGIPTKEKIEELGIAEDIRVKAAI